MFGPIRKGKSGPSAQERLMGVLKDSCFHQLGEPEVNGDPHEELIPSPGNSSSIISSIIQHDSLSSSV